MRGRSIEGRESNVPVDGALVRQQMLVLFAVIVVYVRGDNPVAHDFKSRLDSGFHVRVADIEAELQIVKMRLLDEPLQRLRGPQFAQRVFQSDYHAAMLRKNGEDFQRTERRIEFPRIGGLPSLPHVLDEIRKRNALGHFQSAFHLVHGVDTANSLGIGDRKRVAAVPARSDMTLRGRMERMEREAVLIQHSSEVADRARVSR